MVSRPRERCSGAAASARRPAGVTFVTWKLVAEGWTSAAGLDCPAWLVACKHFERDQRRASRHSVQAVGRNHAR